MIDYKDTTLYQDGYYDGWADGFCGGIVASFGFVFLVVIIGCVLSGCDNRLRAIINLGEAPAHAMDDGRADNRREERTAPSADGIRA